MRPSTLRGKLSAIRFIHVYGDQPDPTKTSAGCLAMRRASLRTQRRPAQAGDGRAAWLSLGTLERLRAGLEEAGVRQSGHSMRVGDAQDMLLAGFDALAVMQAGGWKTPHIVLRYVEQAHTEQLYRERWQRLGSRRTSPFKSQTASLSPLG